MGVRNFIRSNALYLFITTITFLFFILNIGNFLNAVATGIVLSGDITNDYTACKQLLKGRSIYRFTEEDRREALTPKGADKLIVLGGELNYKNVHPPLIIFTLSPFCSMEFKHFKIFWTSATLIIMLLTLLLILKSVRLSLKFIIPLFLFVLVWPPFLRNIELGQVQILLTFFVVLVYFFYKKKNTLLEGVFTGVLIMTKFYPGLLLIYYALIKRWKPLYISLITITVIMIITVIVTKDDFLYLMSVIIPEDVKIYQGYYENQSFNGFYSRLFLPSFENVNFTDLAIIISPVLKEVLMILTILCFAFIIFYYKKFFITNYDIGFSTFIILSVLFSPLIFDHSITLLLLPLIIIFKNLDRLQEKILFLFAMLFLIMPTKPSILKPIIISIHNNLLGEKITFLDTLLFYSLRFYGMLLLFFLTLLILRKEPLLNPDSNFNR